MAIPISYLVGTYDETMALLIEAMNYAAYRSRDDQRLLPPDVQLQATLESLRVTSRLTQIMAWLLMQRAVQAGEITSQQAARPEFAIYVVPACWDSDGPEDESLPMGLRSLLDRSHRLYHRALRLECQVNRSWQVQNKASPAPMAKWPLSHNTNKAD